MISTPLTMHGKVTPVLYKSKLLRPKENDSNLFVSEMITVIVAEGIGMAVAGVEEVTVVKTEATMIEGMDVEVMAGGMIVDTKDMEVIDMDMVVTETEITVMIEMMEVEIMEGKEIMEAKVITEAGLIEYTMLV